MTYSQNLEEYSKGIGVNCNGLYAILPRSFFKIEKLIFSASGRAPIRQPSVVTLPKVIFQWWFNTGVWSPAPTDHPLPQLTALPSPFHSYPPLITSNMLFQCHCLFSWDPSNNTNNTYQLMSYLKNVCLNDTVLFWGINVESVNL